VIGTDCTGSCKSNYHTTNINGNTIIQLCYIAPERFVEGGWKNADVGGQTGNLDITANNEVKAGELTPAMDIFAAG
jgi:hypothetical protein